MKCPMRSWPASAVKTMVKSQKPTQPAAKPAVQGSAVRILGIDPGLRHTGWGVIEVKGNELNFVADGVVDTDPKLSLAERLKSIFEGVQSVVATYVPDECGIEESFVNKNPVSTLKLGHARAAVMLAPATAGIPVFEYKPNLVKKSVVGAGHADKNQVGVMIRMLLPESRSTSTDAADALAVAICHAHHRATAWNMPAQRTLL